MKSAFDREMSADQLFEKIAGSTPASLSCVRGYQSNMAPETVKKVYYKIHKSLTILYGNLDNIPGIIDERSRWNPK